jgi:hypothetical protein
MSGSQDFIDYAFKLDPDAYDSGALCASVWAGVRTSDCSLVEKLRRRRMPHKEPDMLEGTAVAMAAWHQNWSILNILLAHIPPTDLCILPYESTLTASGFDWPHLWTGYVDKWLPFWHNSDNIRGSPLFLAVKGGDENIVEALLAGGYSPDALTLFGAVQKNMLSVVNMLVKNGASVNDRIIGIETPLQVAVRMGHRQMGHRRRTRRSGIHRCSAESRCRR